ncbi:uncharacterized protein LAJ45_07603 [Morchella importuna]|uniref:uncharacterized protein n=1 Tax=Morchella importuna TaxID=1174673 RepID=UPI001E8D1F52|nr:uncharacterized protein LAJ45_07603 [Morchella importuna]KAH8148500.1 hypothetical protein LAJ45_07603 [Morchella importuna]
MAGYLPWATIRDHWKVTSGILVSPIGETLNEGREVCDRQGRCSTHVREVTAELTSCSGSTPLLFHWMLEQTDDLKRLILIITYRHKTKYCSSAYLRENNTNPYQLKFACLDTLEYIIFVLHFPEC